MSVIHFQWENDNRRKGVSFIFFSFAQFVSFYDCRIPQVSHILKEQRFEADLPILCVVRSKTTALHAKTFHRQSKAIVFTTKRRIKVTTTQESRPALKSRLCRLLEAISSKREQQARAGTCSYAQVARADAGSKGR